MTDDIEKNLPFEAQLIKKSTALLILLILATIPYLGKVRNDFLNWDDKRFIIQRDSIHHLANIPDHFISGQDGLYRPLRATMYTFAWQVFQGNTVGYQVFGIFLHLFCTLAFFYVVRLLSKNAWIALLAASIFAVHPIHVERVAGVTASFDLLGDGLLLFALALYLKSRQEEDSIKWRAGWAGVAMAAMFSSEMGMLFLPFICCFEFIFHVKDKLWPSVKVWANGVLAFAVTAIYIGCRVVVLGNVDRGVARPAEGFWYNLLTVSSAHFETLKTIFIHWKLTYFHTIPIANSGQSTLGLAALLVHIFLITIAFVLMRKATMVSLGIFWFYIALIPFSQIAPNSPIMQERYAYLPLGGFAIVAGTIGVSVMRRFPQKATLFLVVWVLWLGILGVTTVSHTAEFRTDESLWTATLKASPNEPGSHNNMGTVFMAQNKCRQALTHFETAYYFDPQFTLAARNRSNALVCLKRYPQAFQAMGDYLKLAPDDHIARSQFFKLGIMAGKSEQVISALEPMASKGKIGPENLYLLGVAYHSIGNDIQALKWLKSYLELVPGDAKAQGLINSIDSKLSNPKTP